MRQLTPRQVAEAAWHPNHPMIIEELVEDSVTKQLCHPEFWET